MPPQHHTRTVTSPRGYGSDDDGRQHAPISVDQVATIEPVRRPSSIRRESFIQEFIHSDGPPQIVFLIMLLALGFGSTIGVVREEMFVRFAG